VSQQGSEGTDTRVERLIAAIRNAEKVRLVYVRQRDEIVSIHDVAPVDIRHGDTPRTASTLYVWAWCFAEDKPETHFLDRIQRVLDTGDTFEPSEVVARWVDHWPLPDGWEVDRSWDLGPPKDSLT
jgi:predicted DNA-binding transcriptional regulator YafY